MKRISKFALLKFLSLALAFVVVLIRVFLIHFNFNLALVLVIFPLILVLIFSVLEGKSFAHKYDSGTKRYFYLPHRVLTQIAIRTGAGIIVGSVLFLSQKSILLFGWVITGMILSDWIFFLSRKSVQGFFVQFETGMIRVFTDKLQGINSGFIHEIEFRHDIIYLTLQDKTVVLLETERFKPEEKNQFISAFYNWAKQEKISFSSEATDRFSQLVTQDFS